MRRSEAKKFTGNPRLPDEEHPAVGREFNAGGVMAGRARARWVSRYLVTNQDRWEANLGAARS
ncbi:MAG: hypothetical protein KY393_08695 [Actinobacteria bacterium]|nr:hypothetical protein [Actinomycetota bacterium]